MQIETSTRTVNTIQYISENPRFTAEDMQVIAKDMKSRKIPDEAQVVLGTAKSMSVRF